MLEFDYRNVKAEVVGEENGFVYRTGIQRLQ